MQTPEITSRPRETKVVAVDLDSTLAYYNSGDMKKHGHSYVGKPIAPMVAKVRHAIAQGDEVFIFTARINPKDDTWQEQLDATKQVILIAQWCQQYLGLVLPITDRKSRHFTEFWDDRAQGVIPNVGHFVSELADAAKGQL
jgi:hypothetical protein